MKKLTRSFLLAGSSASSPDIEYAAGLPITDPIVLMRRGREQYLVVPALEFGRVKRAAARASEPGGRQGRRAVHTKVLSPETLGLKGARRRRLSGWALALLQARGIRRVWVPGSFPHGVAVALQRAGIRVHLSAEEIFPERAVKTASECHRIREAQEAAVIAMRAAVAMIADAEPDHRGLLRFQGRTLTSEAVRQTIARVLLERGCAAGEIIVAGGEAAADPHEKGSGPLRAGEAIVVDIFPRRQDHGYWGDLTRTVVKGPPSPELKRMYLAVKAAQVAALAAVRPGVTCATVHACAVNEFRRRRFETRFVDGRGEGFIHSTGHGVGLAIHEAPSVGPNRTRLRAGHIITVEPGLYYPGKGGVRIEDTIEVTSCGWRYLAPCEKRFEI